MFRYYDNDERVKRARHMKLLFKPIDNQTKDIMKNDALAPCIPWLTLISSLMPAWYIFQ
jgi:hypothetical protein